MKSLLGAAIFLAIAAVISSKLYERAKEMEWIEVDSEHEEQADELIVLSYPDTVELSNRDGRVLQVTLLGRSHSHVQFRRAGAGEPFVYDISGLDASSQKLVLEYPENGIQNVSAHMQSGEMSLAELQVENLRKEIERIDEKCAILRQKHAASQSKTERRTLANQYDELQKERVAFVEDMAKYQSR